MRRIGERSSSAATPVSWSSFPAATTTWCFSLTCRTGKSSSTWSTGLAVSPALTSIWSRRHAGSRDAAVGPLVRQRPGVRPPGTWDAFETGVRAIIGQQLTVAVSATIIGRLVERLGPVVPGLEQLGLSRTFPSAEMLAEADLTGLGLTKARAEAIRSFARAVADDVIRLDGSTSLDRLVAAVTAVDGLGPWTAHYLALRLGEPDACPTTDLALGRPSPDELLAPASPSSRSRSAGGHGGRWPRRIFGPLIERALPNYAKRPSLSMLWSVRSRSALNGLLSVLVALLGLIYTGGATAAITQTDQNGTVLIDGQKVFPIVLAKGPERGSTPPDGVDALDEVVDAGVNVFKVSPPLVSLAGSRQTGRILGTKRQPKEVFTRGRISQRSTPVTCYIWRSENRPSRGRRMDAHDRVGNAESSGMGDAAGSRAAAPRPGSRPVRPPDPEAGALHDLRRDPERRPQPRVLRRQHRPLLGPPSTGNSTAGTGRSGTTS